MKKIIIFLFSIITSVAWAQDVKISAMPTATDLTGTTFIPIIQNGVNKKAPPNLFGAILSVSGTSNRITSTGGTNPVIDVSATFEALLGKVANPLSQFASTTSAQLAGVISNETGTGLLVFATSPVFTTPNIGVATGSVSGNAGTATAWATGRTLSISGDLTYTSPSFDGSGNVTAAGTLASTAVTPGSYTNTNLTVDAKGRITAASNGSGGGGTPGGSTTQLQYNNAGAFGGMSAVTYNSGTGVTTFTTAPIVPTGTPLSADTKAANQKYVDDAVSAQAMAAFSTTVPGYVNPSGGATKLLVGDNTWVGVIPSGMLATQAEANAGSDNTKVITPLTLLTKLALNRTLTTAGAAVQTDNQKLIYFNSGSNFNFTVDQLTADSYISFINIGAGTVTFINGSGVTFTGSSTAAPGATGIILYKTATAPIISSGNQGGTVTSVGALSPLFTTATATTTPAFTLINQNANLIYSGPSSGGSAAPSFRSLVAADLPNTAVTPGSYTATDLTVDAQGRITAAANGSGGGSPSLSAIVAATATNTINNAALAQEWQWNTLAGITGLRLSSTSTAAASNAQKVFEILLTGVNGTSAQTTYGAYISNAHTGTTSQNVALLLEATGAATANWGFQIQGNDNAALINQIRNSSSGASASTILRIGNNTSAFAGQISTNSSGNAADGGANSMNITTTSAGGGPLTFGTNSAIRYTISLNGNNAWTQATQSVTHTLLSATQAAHSGGVPTILSLVGGAITGATAGTEVIDAAFSFNRIIQHASNTLVALDRSVFIGARTIAFATSGGVVTDAVTLEVSGDPIVGTNVSSFTRAWTARLLGKVAIGTSMYIGSATGVVAPTALLHLAAGTATASTAPLKFTSGTSLTSAEAGAAEFTTDDLFFTITTGAARKRLLMADPVGGLTSGRVPYVTTNGRVTDATGFTYDGNNVFDLGGATGINITGNNMAIGGANTTGVSNLTLYDGTLAGTVAGFSFNSIAGDPRAVNSNGVAYSIGGSIKDYFTDVNNGTTVETDLYTFTTIASTLSTDGDKLYIKYIGTFNDVTATTQLKIYFGGTAIGDTGALTISATGGWEANATIIRTSSTTVRTSVNISTPGASTALYTKETDVTGLTLSNTNIVKITGTAAGASGGSNDITSKFGSIFFVPAAP